MRKLKDTILGGKYWRWVVAILMALMFLLGITQCRGQCTTSTDTIYGGVCTMYSITPVTNGQIVTECFIFQPETEIIHLDYMLAQGSTCGPVQYSSLQAYIYDLNCNLVHYADIFPSQSNLNAVLDTTQWYYMCVRFRASCTLNAICPQYNLSYLPIVLDYFKARVSDKYNVLLEWRSYSETNNAYYEIERADSNFVFIPIYREYTPVFSDIPRYYTYTDNLVPDGTVYYRLSQTDIDGCTTRFNIVSINNHKSIKSYIWEEYDYIGRQIKELK